MARVPAQPKLYHIVHVDRLPSIVRDGFLWSDAGVRRRQSPGTVIGIPAIKQNRMANILRCHPGLHVGDCVPFYFCPRSVMLFLIHKANHPGLTYRAGQDPIVHLESDLMQTVTWANRNRVRWVFTLSNAGSWYFEDRCDLAKLHDIDWHAVGATYWQHCSEEKQAEFLIEQYFPWRLVSRIGVRTIQTANITSAAIQAADRPPVQIMPYWYY